ncbi:hypothetical protein DL93DRAFT_112498 [Clavulina sp. PMI_390]|nr:hypothetical protein DL93DRAFT_112498 [Clavulina sp. PMI_390]
MTIELHILCYLIANFKSLQKVTISSIETYSQRKNLLKQRMAILELARPNKEPIWLRLERKKQAYTSQVDTLGITERTQEMSQISVQLAAQKEILFGHGKTLRENRQLFNVAPTFRQLRRFLRALDGQIPAYLGWPEAGWFFCSFLQQHIGRLNDGYYEEGKAQNLELAPRIRDWVNARLRIPQTPGSDSISRSNPAPMSWPNNSHPSPASVDASPTLSTVSDEVLEELMLPPAWDQPSVFRRLWCW